MVYGLLMTSQAPHGAQKPPTTVFLAATIVIFFLSLSAADSIGLVPDYIDGTVPDTIALSNIPELTEIQPVVTGTPTEPIKTELPARIEISAIGLDLAVSNPATKELEALDLLLQKGPARYVDSAKLGEKGNMIIFGHSSHLPIVRNQMYKAFNRIPELEAGDRITVTSTDGTMYTYAVTSVNKVNAEDTRIDMSQELGTRLTIVTCDTLTSKSSRFVLEARLIGSIETI